MQSLKVFGLKSLLSVSKLLVNNASPNSYRLASNFGANGINSSMLLSRFPMIGTKCAVSTSVSSASEDTFPLDVELQSDTLLQAICERSHASIGSLAPKFTTDAVLDGQFKKISLSDYQGQYVVLFFYPMDFTFVCPTEIIAFSDRIEEFQKLNVSVLGVSTDSKFAHLEWISKSRNVGGVGELKYPLLADKNHSISRSYGVLKHDDGIPYRGLFIIDPNGIVRQITINDLPVGRSVDETLRLVQALQYVEKYGEVCPAGWTPGSDAIKPSNSKEYFSKKN